ncbi:hypothetical protein RF11_09914 [Thelohanellus kitauei]|uniref:Uncharacterized protein n=1 Tax=Thelohanellus kitauei TaxID=669202 RepID=A0A0C2MWL3_THEKT|nr:hypothetical protein RF11_09914 [Thelohanellus kitauei]
MCWLILGGICFESDFCKSAIETRAKKSSSSLEKSPRSSWQGLPPAPRCLDHPLLFKGIEHLLRFPSLGILNARYVPNIIVFPFNCLLLKYGNTTTILARAMIVIIFLQNFIWKKSSVSANHSICLSMYEEDSKYP